MTHILENHLGIMSVGVGADDLVMKYSFSDPGMLPVYLMTGKYYSEGKIQCNGIVNHFRIKFTKRNSFDGF